MSPQAWLVSIGPETFSVVVGSRSMSSIDDGVGVDVGTISNDCEASVAVTDCAVATARSAESAMKDLMV